MDSKDLDQAFQGLMIAVHAGERDAMEALFKESPEVAREVIRESAKILMGAKSIAVVQVDSAFDRLCANLIALSSSHPSVRQIFGAIANADLGSPAGDRLMDPAMLPVARARIERVMECLG